MTIWIFISIIIAAVFSRSMSLLVAGVLFSFIQFTHQCYFGPYAEDYGVAYGIAAIISDAMCVGVIVLCSSLFDRNWHLIPFSIIMFASIANNFVGLMGWRGYESPDLANRFGDYIYMSVVILLVGSSFSGRVITACCNFFNRNSSIVRLLPRNIKGDS